MVELTPSDDAVKQRADELETRLRRVAALVVAAADAAAHLPSGSRDVDAVQALLSILEEQAPLSVGDCLWLKHGFTARRQQIATALLRSVA